MLLSTPIDVKPMPVVDYDRPFLLLGSCFSEHIGQRLLQSRFPGCVNPFGVLYNPQSILQALQRLWDNKPFTADELVHAGGLWHSFMHHGRFSSSDADTTLQHINSAYSQSALRIANVKTYIITFGSSWVYERNGEVVANCHKMPQREFTQRRLTVDEIVNSWTSLIRQIQQRVPDAEFLFTVSPIRYREHGPLAAGTNKAVLLLAVEQLVSLPGVHYFPSYEIMMDELRDYRFYAADMIHPSDVAVEYIWERFKATQLTREAQTLLPRIEHLTKQLAHRPLHPDSEESRRFQQKLQEEIALLKQQYPHLDL